MAKVNQQMSRLTKGRDQSKMEKEAAERRHQVQWRPANTGVRAKQQIVWPFDPRNPENRKLLIGLPKTGFHISTHGDRQDSGHDEAVAKNPGLPRNPVGVFAPIPGDPGTEPAGVQTEVIEIDEDLPESEGIEEANEKQPGNEEVIEETESDSSDVIALSPEPVQKKPEESCAKCAKHGVTINMHTGKPVPLCSYDGCTCYKCIVVPPRPKPGCEMDDGKQSAPTLAAVQEKKRNGEKEQSKIPKPVQQKLEGIRKTAMQKKHGRKN